MNRLFLYFVKTKNPLKKIARQIFKLNLICEIKGDISRISLISFNNRIPKLMNEATRLAAIKKSKRVSNFLLSSGLVVTKIIGKANNGSLIRRSLKAYSKSVVYRRPITCNKNKETSTKAGLLLIRILNLFLKFASNNQFPSRINCATLKVNLDKGILIIIKNNPAKYNAE
ncbi:MAG: hypothetical protein K8R86_06390 [Bacteroidales bacterium]|nr:hypothetical protein [Bacteroidales bacterium]